MPATFSFPATGEERTLIAGVADFAASREDDAEWADTWSDLHTFAVTRCGLSLVGPEWDRFLDHADAYAEANVALVEAVAALAERIRERVPAWALAQSMVEAYDRG